MKKRNITSRDEVITRDIVPEVEVECTFNIPSLGVSVKAKTMSEALIKAKEIIKSKK